MNKNARPLVASTLRRTIITALLALAAMAGQGQNTVGTLADTYWRNEMTGDWLIGITKNHVIYDNKVWDIVARTEKKDAYTLAISDGTTIRKGYAALPSASRNRQHAAQSLLKPCPTIPLKICTQASPTTATGMATA